MMRRMEVENVVEAEAPALLPVGEWPSLAEANEHALVVLAMGLECWILPGEGSYVLLADPGHAASVRREFSLYASEQVERRERAEPPFFPAGIELMLLWIAALVGTFICQQHFPDFTGRFMNSSRALVEGGEWWRPFTALFLHADGGHLLSNIGIGGIFCVMVAHTVGAWRAWLLILASGTLGNAINAWARFPDNFSSLGASTATFGALGILVGIATISAWKYRSAREFRPLVAPVLVGLVMLGMYGTGGERTDVAGHFAGWSCGAVLGCLVATKDRPALRPDRPAPALAGS